MRNKVYRTVVRIKNLLLSALSNIFTSIGVFVKSTCLALMTIIKGKHFKPDHNVEKKVLILGNGPSLSEVDVFAFCNEYDIACVNWYALRSDDFFRIKPTHYFLLDPNFFSNDTDTFYDKNERRGKLFDKITKVDWDMELIIPQRLNIPLDNDYIRISHITTMQMESDHLSKYLVYLYSRNLLICGMQNVICGALHYFVVKRYGEIYLAGIDMNEFQSYAIGENNHVIGVYKHFYGEEKVDFTETNYIPKGCFYKWLEYYAKMLTDFYYISNFAEQQNVKVWNLTLNSYVDSFEKINWKNVFLDK